jgi:PadR family transcriptional regulator PadR
MVDRIPYKNRAEVMQGALDMLILKTLQWRPLHGYGIVHANKLGRVALRTDRVALTCTASAGAPGMGAFRVEQTESIQCAKFYRITAAGKKRLASGWDVGSA